VLRLGREGIEMLAADGEEDALRRAFQRGDGGREVRDAGPVVAFGGRPGRAFQGDQRGAGGGAGGDGVGAHLRGEGVGRVDHMGDLFGLKVGDKPLYPAKAADAHVDRLAHRRLGPAGVGVDAGQARFGDRLGHEVRLGRAAEQEYACHGVIPG
jgi:hypothetical protein